jgi:hypothetical protein
MYIYIFTFKKQKNLLFLFQAAMLLHIVHFELFITGQLSAASSAGVLPAIACNLLMPLHVILGDEANAADVTGEREEALLAVRHQVGQQHPPGGGPVISSAVQQGRKRKFRRERELKNGSPLLISYLLQIGCDDKRTMLSPDCGDMGRHFRQKNITFPVLSLF